MTERETAIAVRNKLATYAADVAPMGEEEMAALEVIKACNTSYWVKAWLHYVTGFDAEQCTALFDWVAERLYLPEDTFARRFNWLCSKCRENPMVATRYVAQVVARSAKAKPVPAVSQTAATVLDTLTLEACPGCGCMPGDGVTPGCNHEDGCGFFS